MIEERCKTNHIQYPDCLLTIVLNKSAWIDLNEVHVHQMEYREDIAPVIRNDLYI